MTTFSRWGWRGGGRSGGGRSGGGSSSGGGSGGSSGGGGRSGQVVRLVRQVAPPRRIPHGRLPDLELPGQHPLDWRSGPAADDVQKQVGGGVAELPRGRADRGEGGEHRRRERVGAIAGDRDRPTRLQAAFADRAVYPEGDVVVSGEDRSRRLGTVEQGRRAQVAAPVHRVPDHLHQVGVDTHPRPLVRPVVAGPPVDPDADLGRAEEEPYPPVPEGQQVVGDGFAARDVVGIDAVGPVGRHPAFDQDVRDSGGVEQPQGVLGEHADEVDQQPGQPEDRRGRQHRLEVTVAHRHRVDEGSTSAGRLGRSVHHVAERGVVAVAERTLGQAAEQQAEGRPTSRSRRGDEGAPAALAADQAFGLQVAQGTADRDPADAVHPAQRGLRRHRRPGRPVAGHDLALEEVLQLRVQRNEAGSIDAHGFSRPASLL